MSFKTVHVQHIHLADDEWSDRKIGDKYIMEALAEEWLNAHKHLIKDNDHICVEVYEHAGWRLSYTLDSKGKPMVVSSANDAAVWEGEKKAWKELAYKANWKAVGPDIRRKTGECWTNPNTGEVYTCHSTTCQVHGERNRQ